MIVTQKIKANRNEPFSSNNKFLLDSKNPKISITENSVNPIPENARK